MNIFMEIVAPDSRVNRYFLFTVAVVAKNLYI